MIRVVYVDIAEEDLRPDRLSEAVAGRVPAMPPSAALAVAAEADAADDRGAILPETVRNGDLPAHVRAAAVCALVHRDGADAAAVLVEGLESGDRRVAAAAAAALGRVGGTEHLQALRQVRTDGSDDLLRRKATFAEALIVHRFGVTDHEVELPAVPNETSVPTTGAATLVGVRPGPARRARALDGIARDLPSFADGVQEVVEVQCGPRLGEVAVARDLVDGGSLENLRRAPGMPAVVAFQSPEHDNFSAALLVLSRPAGDGVELMVTRLGGEPVFVGEGVLDGQQGEFALRSVAGPGIVPTELRVRVTAAGVGITGRSDRRAVPARSPDRAPD